MANQPLHLANNAQKKNRFCFPATPFSQQKNVTCHVLLLTFNRRVYSLVSWSLKKSSAQATTECRTVSYLICINFSPFSITVSQQCTTLPIFYFLNPTTWVEYKCQNIEYCSSCLSERFLFVCIRCSIRNRLFAYCLSMYTHDDWRGDSSPKPHHRRETVVSCGFHSLVDDFSTC